MAFVTPDRINLSGDDQRIKTQIASNFDYYAFLINNLDTRVSENARALKFDVVKKTVADEIMATSREFALMMGF